MATREPRCSCADGVDWSREHVTEDPNCPKHHPSRAKVRGYIGSSRLASQSGLYKSVLELIDELIKADPAAESPEGVLLDELVSAAKEYERKKGWR